MSVILRPYQNDMVSGVHQAWNQGARDVLLRAPPGAGKTATFGFMHQNHQGASVIAAHRQELVGQISETLGRYGIYHDVIAAEGTRKAIARNHVAMFGKCYYRPGSPCRVASVDTLIRAQGLESWAKQVTLVTIDEAHHLVKDNKWSAALAMFTHPERRGLLPTATPCRADGKGLGRHHDGYADTMVQGPSMRWLIDNRFLADYDVVCPPSDMELIGSLGSSGDWSTKQLREAAQRSHIVGDIVQHYKRWAWGWLGVTFSPDVQTAIEITAAFRAAGVVAETLTGKTDDTVRRDMLTRYRRREVRMLVTVDIISEGFDLPAMEVAIMGRRTESLSLFDQQFCRPLRIDPERPDKRALIIDPVSNTVRHLGPPDANSPNRQWTLDRRDKRGKSAPDDAIPIRVCSECLRPYERIYRNCPFCGYAPPVMGRGGPAAVDGDLALMDAETLAKLRGDVALVDASPTEERMRLEDRHVPPIGIAAGVNRHKRRAEAQAALRATMAQWGGLWRMRGDDDVMLQRRFALMYGHDVLSAQALPESDANALRLRVDESVNSGR